MLLRHGADAGSYNNVHERPVDVATDQEVIRLLSSHTDEHLPLPYSDDDVKPDIVTSQCPVTPPQEKPVNVATDQDAKHLLGSHAEHLLNPSDNVIPVTSHDDDVTRCPPVTSHHDVIGVYHHEPLDLSIPKGALTLSCICICFYVCSLTCFMSQLKTMYL